MADSIWVPETFRARPYARSRFRTIVAWASANHPFYQRFCPDPGQQVPILTRDVFSDNNELLLNGAPETGRTSGSTGVPVRVGCTPLKRQREKLAGRLFREQLGDAMSRLRIVSLREMQAGEQSVDICRPLPEQLSALQAMARSHPRMALVTYPSNAVNLAMHMHEQGVMCPEVARLVCYAESYDYDQEPLLEAAFPNARIWNNYSCSEVGFIAYRCPYEPDYMHINAINVGVEVLNAEDRPCAEGERGRIVVTDWFNQATPFIRYDIGDMAIAGRCPCGQIPYPSLRRVLGKVRGFLKGLDGQPRVFANIGAELKQYEGLRQYQIVQDALNRLTVRYVANTGCDTADVEAFLATKLTAFIGFEPSFCFIQEKEILREANGKFYATKCNV